MYITLKKKEYNCNFLQNSNSLDTSVRYRYKCLSQMFLSLGSKTIPDDRLLVSRERKRMKSIVTEICVNF